jgi:hypothetical protein
MDPFKHMHTLRQYWRKRDRNVEKAMETAMPPARELGREVLCCPACGYLKNVGGNHRKKLSLYQELATDGCESCQLLLDLVETYHPGWAKSPSLAMILPEVSTEADNEEHKEVSIDISSYLIRVSLVELVKRNVKCELHFEFFKSPSK